MAHLAFPLAKFKKSLIFDVILRKVMIMDCVFCRIIEKKAPAKIVYEDENTIVFHDKHPVAPIHLLICPKKHYDRLMDAPPEAIPKLIEVVKKLAKQYGVDESGFRLNINNGRGGGQIIFHLHIHFMARKP
jgi:histidine triad (HIT) family protein